MFASQGLKLKQRSSVVPLYTAPKPPSSSLPKQSSGASSPPRKATVVLNADVLSNLKSKLNHRETGGSGGESSSPASSSPRGQPPSPASLFHNTEAGASSRPIPKANFSDELMGKIASRKSGVSPTSERKTLERKDSSQGRSAELHSKLKARQLRAAKLAEAGFDAFNTGPPKSSSDTPIADHPIIDNINLPAPPSKTGAVYQL